MAERQLAVGLNLRDRFTSGINKASKGIDKFTSRGIARFKAMALSATGLSAAIGTISAALTVRSLVNFGKSVLELDDKIHKLSIRTGISAETLSALKFAGEQSGIEFDDVASSMEKLQRNMSDLRIKGTLELRQAFAALGGGILESVLAGEDAEDLYLRIADAFHEMEDPVTRTGIALTILGRSGGKFLPTLVQGSKALKDLTDEAKRYGSVVSFEAVEASAAFNDEMNRLKTIFRSLAAEGIRQAIPQLQKLVEGFREFAREDGDSIIGAFKSVTESITDMTRAMLTLLITIDEARLGALKIEKMSKQSALGAITARSTTLEGKVQNIKDVASLLPSLLHRKFALDPKISKPGQKTRPQNDKVKEWADSLVASPQELQAIDMRMAELRIRIDDMKRLRDSTGKAFGPDLSRDFKHPGGQAQEKPKKPEGFPEGLGIQPSNIDKQARIAVDAFDQVRTGADGVRAAINALADRTPYETMRQGMSLVANTIEDSLATGLADLSTGVMRTKEDFAEFARSTVRALTQILVRMLLIKGISAGLSFFGFGSTGAEGAAQLGAKSAVPDFSGSTGNLLAPFVQRKHGGVVSGPSSGFPIIAHGTEAVIPLSSRGSSIPVEMRGAGQPVSISVNVQAIDSKSFDDRFFETLQRRLTPIAENLAQEVNSRGLLAQRRT